MPLFGQSVVQRYRKLGPLHLPSFCDKATCAVIEAAVSEMIKYSTHAVGFRPELEAVSRQEIRQLVLDGYVIGRIEEETEREILRFSTAQLIISEPEEIFKLICSGAVKVAASPEPFTATMPRNKDISQLLGNFAREAAASVADAGSDEDEGAEWRRFGSILSAAIHLGREIALIGGYFLNPKKRKHLPMVLKTVDDQLG